MRRVLHIIISGLRKAKKLFAFTTPVAVIIGALIIGGSILGYGFIMRDGQASASVTMFMGKAINTQTDITEGNQKSKVIIAEYSDPECPFCVTLYPTMKQLRNEYSDKVSFVYRHFPLTQIHPHSFDESKAIACAYSMGGSKKAIEYIDAIYGYKSSKQTTELEANGKEELAKGVGLDAPSFTTCLTNQTTADTVTASMNDGVAAGVQGTPSTFILVKNRKGYQVVAMIDGARPYAYFKAAIDQALAE
jgi:protein-disulfide isomerase